MKKIKERPLEKPPENTRDGYPPGSILAGLKQQTKQEIYEIIENLKYAIPGGAEERELTKNLRAAQRELDSYNQ